jgi:hypothetical protein
MMGFLSGSSVENQLEWVCGTGLLESGRGLNGLKRLL